MSTEQAVRVRECHWQGMRAVVVCVRALRFGTPQSNGRARVRDIWRRKSGETMQRAGNVQMLSRANYECSSGRRPVPVAVMPCQVLMQEESECFLCVFAEQVDSHHITLSLLHLCLVMGRKDEHVDAGMPSGTPGTIVVLYCASGRKVAQKTIFCMHTLVLCRADMPCPDCSLSLLAVFAC